MAKSTSTPFLPGKETIDVLTFYIKLGKRKGLPLSRTYQLPLRAVERVIETIGVSEIFHSSGFLSC